MSSRLTQAETARFQAFLARAFAFEADPASSATPETQQRRFWEAMRAAVSGHPMTSGLAALDQLAESIFRGDAAPTLAAPAALFPGPATANTAATDKPTSTPTGGTASDPSTGKASSSPTPSTTSPTAATKTKSAASSKRKVSSDPSAKKPVTKKTRSSGKSKLKTAATATASRSSVLTPLADVLHVSQKAPDSVRLAIEAVLAKAQDANRIPWHMAYPWTGSNLWYDPKAFPDLYRSHWRFWMRNRKAFWLWALHVPLDDRQALASRRKIKFRAVKERLVFLSECIETWGFYGFLEKLDVHPEMFWLGGQPGRTSSDARGTGDIYAEDLASLERRDPVRYQATLDNALEPGAVDAFSYPHVRALLENTEALSPSAGADYRLSDNALARIRFDITSSAKPRDTWVGSRQDDPWKTLVNSDSIKRVQLKLMKKINAGTYKIPTSAPVTKAECNKADWSDLEADGDDEADKAEESGGDDNDCEDDEEALEDDEETADE